MSTFLVLGEFHTHLRYRVGPEIARRTVGELLDDPAYEWRDVTGDLVRGGITAWLDRFEDQPFSLTDVVSFELMRSEGITKAFSFDRHFQVAGFDLLT